MKTWLKMSLAFAFILLIAVILVFKFYINKPQRDIAAAKPDYSLTTGGIWKEYINDSKTTGLKYDGKVVELEGELTTSENRADTAFTLVFVMDKDELFGNKSIRCEMLPGWIEKSKTLKPASIVKVKGLVNGFDETDLKLSKCSTVN